MNLERGPQHRSKEKIESKVNFFKEIKEKENPVFKIAIFDLEGPLVDIGKYRNTMKIGGMWHHTFEKMGMLSEHSRLREKYVIKGEYPDYVNWTAESCEALKKKGLTKAKLSQIMDTLHIRDGAEETISSLKAQGFKTAIVTGCIGDLAERVQKKLGIDYVAAHCNFEFDDKGKLKDWILLDCDYKGKIDYVYQIARGFGFSTSECIYIGNGSNDIPAFKVVGYSIAFNPHEERVKKAADTWIGGTNLRLTLEAISIATEARLKTRSNKYKRNIKT